MTDSKRISFHTVVIGSGSSGRSIATRLAEAGKRVAVIESETFGGRLHIANLPSASYVYDLKTRVSAHAAYATLGKSKKSPRSYAALLRASGVVMYEGVGSFVSDHEINVSRKDGKNTQVSADTIVIATGSIHDESLLTNIPARMVTPLERIIKLHQLNQPIVFIGSSSENFEAASIFSAAGSQIHLVSPTWGIDGITSPDITSGIIHTLQKTGVTFHWHTSELAYAKGSLIIKNARRNSQIRGNVNVVVLRSKPDIATLRLENTAVITTQNGIETNEVYQTSVPHIFATHRASSSHRPYAVPDEQDRITRAILYPYLPRQESNISQYTFRTNPEIAVVIGSKSGRVDSPTHVSQKIEASQDKRRTNTLSNRTAVVWIRNIRGTLIQASFIGPGAGQAGSRWAAYMEQSQTVWGIGAAGYGNTLWGLLFERITAEFMRSTHKNLLRDMSQFVLMHLRRIAGTYATGVGTALLWLYVITLVRPYMPSNPEELRGLVFAASSYLARPDIGYIAVLMLIAGHGIIRIPFVAIAILSGYLWGFPWGTCVFVGTLLLISLIGYGIGRFSTNRRLSQSMQLPVVYKDLNLKTLIALRNEVPFDELNFYLGTRSIAFVPFSASTIFAFIMRYAWIVALGASIERFNGDLYPVINSNDLTISLVLLFGYWYIRRIVGQLVWRKNTVQ